MMGAQRVVFEWRAYAQNINTPSHNYVSKQNFIQCANSIIINGWKQPRNIAGNCLGRALVSPLWCDRQEVPCPVSLLQLWRRCATLLCIFLFPGELSSDSWYCRLVMMPPLVLSAWWWSWCKWLFCTHSSGHVYFLDTYPPRRTPMPHIEDLFVQGEGRLSRVTLCVENFELAVMSVVMLVKSPVVSSFVSLVVLSWVVRRIYTRIGQVSKL